MDLYRSLTSYGLVPLLVSSVVGSWLAYVLSVAFYNVTLHPLAKFPGPKLRGAFIFPEAHSLWSGNHVYNTYGLHKKYGPVVRLSPTSLSFNTPQAWKDIYGFRAGKRQLLKDPKFYVRDKNDRLPPGLVVADDVNHARARRLLSNAFSDNALRGQEEILGHYFELFVQRLKEQVDGASQGRVNIVDWFNFTTFDVIGDLSFGESFHALESRDYHPWIRTIFRATRFGRWLRLGGHYPLFLMAMNKAISFFPQIRQARMNHLNYVRLKTEKRLDITSDRKDFIHYILRATDEKGLSRGEIIANSSLLIAAGSETTATLLSGATYYLLKNPEKLARLQTEIRGSFSSAEELTLVSLGKMPYLQAVIEESLRIYPPVATLLPRRTPLEGDMIDGSYVAGDTTVGVHHWSAYRDERNFADADSFVPERWLSGKEQPDRYKGDKREALQPFSVGPRNCLGKNLAYNEIRALLARVIWHFDMELFPESNNWSKQKGLVFWSKPELFVRLQHRKL